MLIMSAGDVFVSKQWQSKKEIEKTFIRLNRLDAGLIFVYVLRQVKGKKGLLRWDVYTCGNKSCTCYSDKVWQMEWERKPGKGQW